MNKTLISTLLCAAVVTAQAEPSAIDELVVTVVTQKPLLWRNVVADVKQAPTAIVPTITLPPLALPARVPERS